MFAIKIHPMKLSSTVLVDVAKFELNSYSPTAINYTHAHMYMYVFSTFS